MASHAKTTFSKRSHRDEKIAKKRTKKSRLKLTRLKAKGMLGTKLG